VTPEEIELLSELTVVIPTYDRPVALERSIEYWRDTPVKVQILDGSDAPWLSVGTLVDAPRITYHHLPKKNNETDRSNYNKRMLYSRSIIDTAYVALCGDDDFFALSGLCAILSELSRNKEVGGGVGATLWFNAVGGEFLCRGKYVDVFENLDSYSQDVGRRLKFGLDLYYGILKTDVFVMRQSLAFGQDFEIDIYHEDLTQYLGRVITKSISISQVCWLRQSLVPTQFSYRYNSKALTLRQSCESLRLFETQLASGVQVGDPDISLYEAKQIVRKFLRNNWNSMTKISKLKIRIKALVLRYLTGFSDKIPLKVKKRVNYLSKYLVSREIFVLMEFKRSLTTGRRQLDDLLIEFEKAGIGFNHGELRSFEKLMLKPREELRLRVDI
jgi:glycosyltransferase domain-containing protein